MNSASSCLQVDEDEHFIVWMRVAALPNFRKLWGKINVDLKKGDVITVNVQNLYNTYSFGGQKKLVSVLALCRVLSSQDLIVFGAFSCT